MKNYSPFQGWKELHGKQGDFRFENRGAAWGVYKKYGYTFVHIGSIHKKDRETNVALYSRASDLVLEA